MTPPAFDTAQVKFEIVSQTDDSWNVQFRIDVAELVDHQSLLKHLRAIKQKIALSQRIHEASMLFDGTVSKTRNEDYVDVVVRIKRVVPEKGNPSVTFKDGIARDGTHYSRMTALLDIFYLDRFERVITPDRVLQATLDAKIPAHLLDKETIQARIRAVLDNRTPLKGIPIAKGDFPDIGKDAELEFYFHAAPDPGQSDAYYSSRRVNSGDILCRKHPATAGEHAGQNVLGDSLPPRAGLDITLQAESGTTLSLDGTEISAATEGVVVITRTMQKVQLLSGVKEIPQSVAIKVNPVLKVEGNQVLDIATSQTVEVVGNLQMGSRILTDCEVFVTGDVEEGTLIEAADSITIEGQVQGATLSSQSSVTLQGDVRKSSVISAHGGVVVAGEASDSSLVGDTVSAGSIKGCKVVASAGVTIGRVNTDENNVLNTICVGMADFFHQRLRDNEVFLHKARDNQQRIEILMGKEIVAEVTPGNVQTMLLRFLARSRVGQYSSSRKQIEVYRKLLESVPPSRSLIAQKETENAELLRRIEEQNGSSSNMVIVRERISAPLAVSIDGAEGDVAPCDGPLSIRANADGALEIAAAEAA